MPTSSASHVQLRGYNTGEITCYYSPNNPSEFTAVVSIRFPHQNCAHISRFSYLQHRTLLNLTNLTVGRRIYE